MAMVLSLLLSAALLTPARAGGSVSDLVVDPGGPYTVEAGSTVELDGSGSVTFSCSSVEYGWDLDGDYEVDLDAGSSVTATFDATDIDGPESRRINLFLTCWLPGDVDSVVAREGTGLSVLNAPPVIEELSYSPSELEEGDSVHLEVDWSDPEPADTHTFTWQIERLGSFTGESLDVVLPQDGDIEVVVTVADDDRDEDVQAMYLEVANVAPDLGGDPPGDARVDEEYSFTPTVYDPGVEDELRFSAELPAGASLDSETGAILWTPTAAQEGDWDLSLSVQDEDGAGDTLMWIVTVASSAPASEEPRDSGSTMQLEQQPPDLAGEGCSCGAAAAAPALWMLGLLPLVGLRRRG